MSWRVQAAAAQVDLETRARRVRIVARTTARAARRHGAFLAVEDGPRIVRLASTSTVTKRGSRRAFLEMQRQMIQLDVVEVALQEPSVATLVASRLEAGQVVEQVRVPFPGSSDASGSGAREPRRPAPSAGHTAAAADPADS